MLTRQVKGTDLEAVLCYVIRDFPELFGSLAGKFSTTLPLRPSLAPPSTITNVLSRVVKALCLGFP